MPVTFSVATHPTDSINLNREFTAKDILDAACGDQVRYVEEVLQYGFSQSAAAVQDAATREHSIFPDSQGNGFVNTVLDAYNQHRALVIRPDDVWLTILSQFNFFVNANAELMRANFVEHEGQKELVVHGPESSAHTADYGAFSRQMVDMIEKNIIDPTLREWVLPQFTTTTENDITVAAVLMMATLKQYFKYGFAIPMCGIPRVTLDGERSDWANILGRLEKLKEYEIETIAWYHLLHPVISAFIAAFDAPESKENVEFWQRVAFFNAPFSGPQSYSGWITAFAVFNKDGKWLGHPLDKTAVGELSPDLMTTEQFWATYCKFNSNNEPYHRIIDHDIPPAYAEVDVKLTVGGAELDCLMLAGMVGTRISSSGDMLLSSTGQNDMVQPASGWWMCTKKQNVVSAEEEYAAEMEELMRELDEDDEQQ
ncbi:hypothetical protein MSAN_01238900 [Mycena sanguinolenta]|uniref:DUF4419 domain-containing protein n=1 Tax=Mycena sanguinolenta TaxID=230812 RepID=A0A8H6YIQ5_9AGAR|nr:hypothetical protein MSAN_01238900 [Mycena sanguinolenta]